MSAVTEVFMSAELPSESGFELDDMAPLPVGMARVPQRRYLVAATPWRAQDFSRAVLLYGAGVLGVGACWYGVSGEALFRDQEKWIVGAVGASVVAALGLVGWLIAGFREVRLGQHDLMTDLRRLYGLDGQPHAAKSVGVTGEFVFGSGMTVFHRPDCLLARGKALTPVTHDRALDMGLGSCGVCCS